jgi:hypothetical protein
MNNKSIFCKLGFYIFICLIPFSSCNKKNVNNPYESERKQLEKTIDISSENSQPNEVLQSNSSKVDFDLTKMSATMIYAEVFNMLIEPEKYENKRLKIKGLFTIYNEGTNDEVYSVIVPDATACCQQGIEFFYNFENRPTSGSEIIVTGIFKIHQLSEENGITYNYIQAENVE